MPCWAGWPPARCSAPTSKVILQLLEITAGACRPWKAWPWNWTIALSRRCRTSIVTDDPNKAFKDCNWALLVGSFPRKQGMERKDLLGINGKIFVGQGKALAANAAKDVRILVVGNPCNTNCLVAYHNGQDIPAERWTAMTRLDHNRARTALAKKAGVANDDVTAVTIWGNHSNTQYPDFTNAKIKGKPATEVITDRDWLENTFVPQCQNRGAAVIKARGRSSAHVGRQRGHRSRQEPAARRRRPTTGSAPPSCRRANTACRRGWCSATRAAATARAT